MGPWPFTFFGHKHIEFFLYSVLMCKLHILKFSLATRIFITKIYLYLQSCVKLLKIESSNFLATFV